MKQAMRPPMTTWSNVERDFDRYPSRDAERLAEERRRARIPRLRLVPTALAVVCLTALALVVGVWWHARTVAAVEAAQPVARVGAAPVSPASVPTAAPTPSATPAETPQTPQPQTPATLFVHVTGAVNRPGVVEVPAGSRVTAAVDAAGGARGDADLAGLNLAAPLTDGQQVHVPTPGEQPTAAALPAGAAASPNPAQAGHSAEPAGPVNLNTATAADLDALPGIGPALAQRILDWRAANGNFATVDELDEVSGIGPAVLERLRPLVTVS
ncbi:ComEA family DNA-binding protein [Micrococcales bacterium 31B]|nr:ComEA family DNA-binding protein [Micrococcales bacterium 31B]